MATSFICPQGHRWEAADAPAAAPAGQRRCPQCGAAPVSDATPPEPPTVSRPPSRGDEPTILASPSLSDVSKEHTDSTVADLPVAALTQGRSFDSSYEVLGELGRGGMAVVYKARDHRLNRIVALKMILAGRHASAEQLTRFRAEAETLAPLQHPHIVQIHEIGAVDGHPYFALEFIEGGSLSSRLAGTPQPHRQAAQLVELLARAIHYAHQRGIVHRDLKPANVLLAPASSSLAKLDLQSLKSIDPTRWTLDLTLWTPKITDFGLAKNLESDSSHTKTGAILGTPSYISPEQASGRKNIGPATDVYSLGAILYELLTGRPPFRGETSMDTMLQVMTEEPVPPRRLQPKVPVDLETICLKCLQKEPHKRYSSAEALADDLQHFSAGEPIRARPSGLWERGFKWARRRPAVAALVVVSVLFFVGALSGSLYWNAFLARTATREQERSQELLLKKTEAEKEKQNAEAERSKALEALKTADEQRRLALERYEESRRSLYAFQLMQAASLAQRDPYKGLELLDDGDCCPPAYQDFTWHYLRRLCRRERASLSGSTGPVESVAVTPNGKMLASSAGDENVSLWDLEKKQLLRTLKTRHAGRIIALAFAPDSQTIASAGFDKSVKLTNVVTGAEFMALEGHSDGVRAVAFAPDGKLLASGSHDRSIILWDLAQEKARSILKGHTGSVCAIAFSPDGAMLASGAADQTVRLWDTATDKELGPPLRGHLDTVLAVAFAPTGKLLASSSADRTIKLWHPAERKPLDTLVGHADAVGAIAFSPDGKTICSAGGEADRSVRLWNSVSGEERLIFKGHKKSVLCLAFTPDAQTLISGSGDQTIKLWDVRPRREPPEFKLELGVELTLEPKERKEPVAALGPEGKTLVTVDQRERSIRLWDLAGRVGRIFLPKSTAQMSCLALAPDGKTLAAVIDERSLRLFDMDKGRPRATLPGHLGKVLCLAFSGDSRLLASGGADQMVRLWDPAGKALSPLPALSGPVHRLAFAPDGKLLATADSRSVKLWDLARAAPVADLDRPSAAARLLAFVPDGKTLIVATSDGTIYLWDTQRKQERVVLKGHRGTVRCLAVSRDSRTLATGHVDGSVVLWDAWAGQERATLVGHTDAVYALSFIGNDQTLISIDLDGVVRYWQ